MNSRCTTHHFCAQTLKVFLLPALTLAVLDKGQLNELMLHEGGPHQLHTDQRILSLSTHILSRFHLSGFGVCVCMDTSMVSVCVSEGTHSRASSAQQPPHRLTDTQDGTKRWWVSPGNSRQTSTRVSRGSHPLLEYTSSHRRTVGPQKTDNVFQFFSFSSTKQDTL